MLLDVIQEMFGLHEIPLDAVVVRPRACIPERKRMIAKVALKELVKGASEPIFVRKIGGEYELLAGDSQYFSAVMRGERLIKAFVGELDDEAALLFRLSEGAKRGDLNVVEEAEMMQELCAEYGLTQREIAMRCGRVQCTVANKLRLLKLPEEVLSALRRGQIGERQARALLLVEDRDKQVELFRRCVKMKLTAEEMENMCGLAATTRRRRGGRRGRKGKAIFKDARIFQNSLRTIVIEMQKAGLNASCEEKSYENVWEFKVLIRT